MQRCTNARPGPSPGVGVGLGHVGLGAAKPGNAPWSAKRTSVPHATYRPPHVCLQASAGSQAPSPAKASTSRPGRCASAEVCGTIAITSRDDSDELPPSHAIVIHLSVLLVFRPRRGGCHATTACLVAPA